VKAYYTRTSSSFYHLTDRGTVVGVRDMYWGHPEFVKRFGVTVPSQLFLWVSNVINGKCWESIQKQATAISRYFLPGNLSLRLIQQYDMERPWGIGIYVLKYFLKVLRRVSGGMHRPTHPRRRRESSTYKTGGWVGQVDGLEPLDINNLLLLPGIQPRLICTLATVRTELQSSYHVKSNPITGLDRP
jgi:hypothetical protein